MKIEEVIDYYLNDLEKALLFNQRHYWCSFEDDILYFRLGYEESDCPDDFTFLNYKKEIHNVEDVDEAFTEIYEELLTFDVYEEIANEISGLAISGIELREYFEDALRVENSQHRITAALRDLVK